jgi:periplasmic protein TonB
MKKTILFGCFIVLGFSVDAQVDSLKTNSLSDSNKIFTSVNIEAQFPGGLNGWKKYLMKNIDGGIAERKHAPSGSYTVIVSFIVSKEGAISDVKADNDPGFGTAKEAIKAIKSSPNWIPATVNNKPVISRKKQPITFMSSNY